MNGLKNGKGTWKKQAPEGSTQNVNCYKGEYALDKKNGYGRFEWASGNYYTGQYKDDERHGYGEMYWVDGSIYKGKWINGIQEDIGLMIFPDGFRRVGFFHKNIFERNLSYIDEFDNFEGKAIYPEEYREELEEALAMQAMNED